RRGAADAAAVAVRAVGQARRGGDGERAHRVDPAGVPVHLGPGGLHGLDGLAQRGRGAVDHRVGLGGGGGVGQGHRGVGAEDGDGLVDLAGGEGGGGLSVGEHRQIGGTPIGGLADLGVGGADGGHRGGGAGGGAGGFE